MAVKGFSEGLVEDINTKLIGFLFVLTLFFSIIIIRHESIFNFNRVSCNILDTFRNPYSLSIGHSHMLLLACNVQFQNNKRRRQG